MKRFPRCFTSLIRRRDGVTAIEFAIIAPILFIMIMAIIEFGLIMFVQNTMEAATNFTARLGKTGFASDGTTQLQTIINKLDQSTGGLLDPNKITVETQVYNEFAGADPNAPSGQNLGNARQIVVYTISYPWKLITPLNGLLKLISSNQHIGDNGIYMIQSRAVVKNEPYAD